MTDSGDDDGEEWKEPYPDSDTDWDDTDLWQGIKDATENRFVLSDYDFKF